MWIATVRRRSHAYRRLVATVVLFLAWSSVATLVNPPLEASGSQAMREVGKVHLAAANSSVDNTGWLILNPTTRRGYQLFENSFPALTTTIQSFDMDNLTQIRRVTVTGVPIQGGTGHATTGYVGEIVHAIDHARGRIFLPLSNREVPPNAIGDPDYSRTFKRVLVIDEKAFDRGDAAFGGSFVLGPTTSIDSQVYRDFFLVGMTIDTRSSGGRVLAVFAQPSITQAMGVFSHRLVGWDWPSAIALSSAASTSTGTQSDPQIAEAFSFVLTPCQSVPIKSGGAGEGNYQWEVLTTESSMFLACHTEQNQGQVLGGQVVRIGLNSARIPIAAPPVEPSQLLGRGISDVLVDPSSSRMYLRNSRRGTTWWVFDARVNRYMGAVVALLGDGVGTSAGLDPMNGRFYALVPDHVVFGTGGKATAARGGFNMSDGYLDPVPALTNVEATMAYPAQYRIQVDPVKRRVYVRRGAPNDRNRYQYPGTNEDQPAPVEPFYTVYEDKMPLSGRVKPSAEGQFTTHASEAPGVTQSSFLGDGVAYGSRTLLVGGLAAATHRGTSGASTCAAANRESVLGEVVLASLSDLSASANSSSWRTDPSTRNDLEHPIARCASRQEAKQLDQQVLDFDADEDGNDDFVAECVEESAHVAAPQNYRGFRAAAGCKRSQGEVTASAGASLSAGTLVPFVDLPVKVAKATSSVRVERKPAGGVEVVSTAKAEGVEIVINAETKVRINEVRTKAVSAAAGRRGTATGDFERYVCDAEIVAGTEVTKFEGCTADRSTQQDFQNNVNALLKTPSLRGQMRFREPDPEFLKGSRDGYRAAVLRQEIDRFGDQVITQDLSVAVPGLEITFYRGDDPAEGAGRQIVQLAAVQASTSYGIACVYGALPGSGCATAPREDPVGDFVTNLRASDEGSFSDGDFLAGSGSSAVAGEGIVSASGRGSGGGGIGGALRRLAQLPVDVARLLFSSPREFLLMLTVWALIYAPCYLGERRRRLRELVANRATSAVGVTA